MCEINMDEKSVDEKNNDEPTGGRFLGLLNIYKWTPRLTRTRANVTLK